MFSHRTTTSALAAVALSALLLTGCSAGSAPQSVKQSCAVIEKDLSGSTSDLSSALSNLQSDPKAAEAALAKLDVTLKKTTEKVTNAKVKAAAIKATKAVEQMDTDLAAYAKDSTDTAGLQSSASKFQTAFVSLSKLCTA